MATNTGTTVEQVNSTCSKLETSPSKSQASSKIYSGGGKGGGKKMEKPTKGNKY